MGEDSQRDSDSPSSAVPGWMRRVARAPAAAPARLLPGTRTGRYVVGELLGSGATSTVYLATDEMLGRTVALKVLRPRLQGPEARAHFLREARTVAAVASPQIVVVYDVGEWEGRIFIAMEHVAGESLRALLRRGELSESRALALARSMVRALVDAHERGIVHRDLKPENLMVTPNGSVKVLDFGLARSATDAQETGEPDAPKSSSEEPIPEETARAVGTRGYMAPEQARGEPIDVRADVYALGVILREMMRRSTHRVALDRIVRRCLADDRANRHANAGALLPELDRLAPNGAPVRGALAAALVAGLVALAVWGVRHMARMAPGPNRGSSSPDTRAADEYALGLDRLRRGSLPSAANAFIEVVARDPTRAEAHLRLAIFTDLLDWEARRAHLSRASAMRGRLTPHDEALLAMAEATVLAEPPDAAALDRAGQDALAKFPDDAEIPLVYALLRRDYVPGLPLDGLLARARIADPESVLPLWLEAEDEADHEDYEGSLRTIARCIDLSPVATSCLRQRAVALEVTGDCSVFEADARRMIVVEPESDVAFYRLAVALGGSGAPLETVHEALHKSTFLSRALPRARGEAEEALFLSMLSGDLTGAESAARSLESQTDTSSSEQAHALAVATLLRIYEETGDDAAAHAVAESYAERSQAWMRDEPFLARPLVDAVLARSKRTAPRAAAASREAAAMEVRRILPPGVANMAWATAYARGVQTADEARAALAALPRYSPLPRGTLYEPYLVTIPAQAVGHTLALAGRRDEAAPWLERASRSCWFFEAPVEYLRAHVELGELREARGDRMGACNSYRTVLERWKDVRPRSATYALARERFDSLACTSSGNGSR